MVLAMPPDASEPRRFCPLCEARLDAEVCPVCHVNTVRLDLDPTDQDDPVVGRVIASRYRIERLIGEGAAGRVYAATQLNLGHEVALKLLHPQHASSAHHVRRFYREARAATRLTSQHVVRVIDFGVDDRTRAPFMVLELLRGETLERWLERTGPLPPRDAARVLAQVGRALVDASQAGIVHRDLKPSNIMRVETGDGSELFKVTDFGVAKDLSAEDSVDLTAHGATIGTPAYMAPEQVTGERVDHRADFYALGCILYEMLAGRRPFEGYARAELLTGHLLTPPPPLPAPLPAGAPMPGALAALLERLLAKSPSDRPVDARAVVAVLDAVAQGRDDGAPPATARPAAPTATQTSEGAALRPLALAPAIAPPARATPLATPQVQTPSPAPTPARPTTPALPRHFRALEEREGMFAKVWRWLRRRPLTPEEKLRRLAIAKRRAWRKHKRAYIAVNGGLFAINVITATLGNEFVPWSFIVMAVWGIFFVLHGFGYRAWREDHADELAAVGVDPDDPVTPRAPALALARTSEWASLVERCRRAVEAAEKQLRGIDTEDGGGAGSRLELRRGLADIERLARGAERLEAALAEVSPGVAEIDAELARLDATIEATADLKLRAVYQNNRELLAARRQRLAQFDAELMRMRATAEGFLLATENIRLDAARIGAPRLHEYEVNLREPLRRLDDEVEVLEQVEAELAAVERELERI